MLCLSRVISGGQKEVDIIILLFNELKCSFQDYSFAFYSFVFLSLALISNANS